MSPVSCQNCDVLQERLLRLTEAASQPISDPLQWSLRVATAPFPFSNLHRFGPCCRNLGKVRPEVVVDQSRDQLEGGLTFIGLLIFRNELKPDTRDAILDLKAGHVSHREGRCAFDDWQCSSVMISDSTLACWLKPQRECGMLASWHRLQFATVYTTKGALTFMIAHAHRQVRMCMRVILSLLLACLCPTEPCRPYDHLGTVHACRCGQ